MLGAPDPSQRAARRATRRVERAQRKADIHRRARMLADQQIADTGEDHWSLRLAIGLIVALWAGGCVWLFREQTRFARHLGFATPQLFSLIVDGMAFIAALLAYGISMAGRTAGGSRIFSTVIISMSAAANGAGAWHRSHDVTTVVVASLVPLVVMWGFHLVLAELRIRVLIRRNRPADKAPPALRLIRLLFAGPWALVEWRAAGLAVTDPLPPPPAAGPPVPPQREPNMATPPDGTGSTPGTGDTATVTSLTGRDRSRAAAARARAEPAAHLEADARTFIDQCLAAPGGTFPTGAEVGAYCGRSVNWGIAVVSAVRRERDGKTG